jgi:hypothetical protein
LIFVLVSTLLLTPYSTGPFLAIGRSIVSFGTKAFALAKFGVLTATASFFAGILLLELPLTTNWSAWYAEGALLGTATVVALALYGFFITLAGRPLWAAKPEAA